VVLGLWAGLFEELALELDVLLLVGRGGRLARASPEDGALVDAGLGVVSVLTAACVAEAALAEPDLVTSTVALRLAFVALSWAILGLKGRAVSTRLKGTLAIRSSSALSVEGAGLATIVARGGECERTLRKDGADEGASFIGNPC
jgi:hypothetical protein